MISMLKTISKLLYKRQFSLFLMLSKLKIDIIKSRIKNLLNPNYISFKIVEVIITEKCTMKCKNCANLMQYYQKPHHIDVKQIIRDIDLLMAHVDFVSTIRLIGGEPLLVKQIPEILAHIRRYKNKYGLLMLTTNGTFVPSNQVLSAIKKANVKINISNYGEKSVRINALVTELKKHKITHSVNTIIWRYVSQVVDAENRKEDDVKKIFQKCNALCKSLLNGKLYLCPFLAHSDNLRLFPKNKLNYIDLMNNSTSKRNIIKWKSKSYTPPGCWYCSGHSNDLPTIPLAEQTKKALSYHRFD